MTSTSPHSSIIPTATTITSIPLVVVAAADVDASKGTLQQVNTSSVNPKDDSIKLLESKLEKQRELLIQAGQKIKTLNETLRAKNNEIAILNSSLQQLKEKLEDRDDMHQKDELIARLRQDIDTLTQLSESRVREEVNKVVQSVTKTSREKQIEYEQKISTLEKELAALEEEYSSYKKRAISLVISSSSSPVDSQSNEKSENCGGSGKEGDYKGNNLSTSETQNTSTSFSPHPATTENKSNRNGSVSTSSVTSPATSSITTSKTPSSNPIRETEKSTQIQKELELLEQKNLLLNETLEKLHLKAENDKVLRSKTEALESQLSQTQKEYQEKLHQQEVLYSQLQGTLSDEHAERVALDAKLEDEKKRFIELQSFTSATIDEKDRLINNLKDTIEILQSGRSHEASTASSSSSPPLPVLPPSSSLQHKYFTGSSMDLPAALTRISLLEVEHADLQSQITLHIAQEQHLKQEIRQLLLEKERNENYSNAEYLKNLVLKYMQSAGRYESLVPVIADILHFSPEEKASVMTASSAPSAGFWSLWK